MATENYPVEGDHYLEQNANLAARIGNNPYRIEKIERREKNPPDDPSEEWVVTFEFGD